jgi:hypothetical protein
MMEIFAVKSIQSIEIKIEKDTIEIIPACHKEYHTLNDEVRFFIGGWLVC